jgi:hypothetical protein
MATQQAHVGRKTRIAQRPADEIIITLSRTEALALVKVAETGVAVTDALGLIQDTSAAKRALDQVRRSAHSS